MKKFLSASLYQINYFLRVSSFVFLVKICSKNNAVSLDTAYILCRNFSSKILRYKLLKNSLFGITFLFINASFAQPQESTPTICELSKACKKACDEKSKEEHNENDASYQELLRKCAEDVAKNLGIIK